MPTLFDKFDLKDFMKEAFIDLGLWFLQNSYKSVEIKKV